MRLTRAFRGWRKIRHCISENKFQKLLSEIDLPTKTTPLYLGNGLLWIPGVDGTLASKLAEDFEIKTPVHLANELKFQIRGFGRQYSVTVIASVFADFLYEVYYPGQVEFLKVHEGYSKKIMTAATFMAFKMYGIPPRLPDTS